MLYEQLPRSCDGDGNHIITAYVGVVACVTRCPDQVPCPIKRRPALWHAVLCMLRSTFSGYTGGRARWPAKEAHHMLIA